MAISKSAEISENAPFEVQYLEDLLSGASPEDLDFVSPALHGKFQREFFERRYTQLHSCSWILKNPENQCVGHIGVVRWTEEPIDWVSHLYIHPGFRSCGYAERLIRFVERSMLSKGAPLLALHVKRDNLRAGRLYRKLGYRVFKEEGEVVQMRKEILVR